MLVGVTSTRWTPNSLKGLLNSSYGLNLETFLGWCLFCSQIRRRHYKTGSREGGGSSTVIKLPLFCSFILLTQNTSGKKGKCTLPQLPSARLPDLSSHPYFCELHWGCQNSHRSCSNVNAWLSAPREGSRLRNLFSTSFFWCLPVVVTMGCSAKHLHPHMVRMAQNEQGGKWKSCWDEKHCRHGRRLWS